MEALQVPYWESTCRDYKRIFGVSTWYSILRLKASQSCGVGVMEGLRDAEQWEWGVNVWKSLEGCRGKLPECQREGGPKCLHN